MSHQQTTRTTTFTFHLNSRLQKYTKKKKKVKYNKFIRFAYIWANNKIIKADNGINNYY